MYKLCKTEGSSKRQREIEAILLDLMKNKKYEDISVTEICEKANMPRKSFYRYFDGKDGAMQSLLYHTLSDLGTLHISWNDVNKKISEEFEELFAFWKSKKDLLDAFEKSGLIGLLIESVNAYAMNEFDDVKQYMSDSESSENIIAYQFVICGIMTMMINWYRSGFAESIPNLSRTATKIITKPLFENLTRTE